MREKQTDSHGTLWAALHNIELKHTHTHNALSFLLEVKINFP